MPRRRNWFGRHKIPTLLVIVGLTGAVAAAVWLPRVNQSNAGRPKVRAAASSPKAPMQQPVKDATTEFKVEKVECGAKKFSSLSDAFEGSSPHPADRKRLADQGKFCFVELSLRNLENKPKVFYVDNNPIFDSRGRQWVVDAQASFAFAGAHGTLAGDYQNNPLGVTQRPADAWLLGAPGTADGSSGLAVHLPAGATVRGVIVYDVPEDVKPDRIELHESAFSKGVSVDLSGDSKDPEV